MKESDIVMGNFFVAPGMRAKFCINDVPMMPAPVSGSWSKQLPINHRLVTGDNLVSLALEESGPSSFRASVDERGVERCSCTIFRKRETGDIEILAHLVVDPSWDGVEEPFRRYPFSAEKSFDPGVVVKPPTWVFSEAIDLPCEGTKEVADFVEAYYEALTGADRDRMIAMTEPFFRDREQAYPGLGYFSRGTLIGEMDEVIASQPTYEPLEPEALHYESRAGGRVVHVSRFDGRAALFGRAPGNVEFKTDILMTKTTGGWRVM